MPSSSRPTGLEDQEMDVDDLFRQFTRRLESDPNVANRSNSLMHALEFVAEFGAMTMKASPSATTPLLTFGELVHAALLAEIADDLKVIKEALR